MHALLVLLVDVGWGTAEPSAVMRVVGLGVAQLAPLPHSSKAEAGLNLSRSGPAVRHV